MLTLKLQVCVEVSKKRQYKKTDDRPFYNVKLKNMRAFLTGSSVPQLDTLRVIYANLHFFVYFSPMYYDFA